MKKIAKLTDEQCARVHEHCRANKKAISKSGRVGCFFCGRIFSAQKVYEWCYPLFWFSKEERVKENLTAICPHCSIDSILPEHNLPFGLSKSLLRRIGKWAWRVASLEETENKE